MTETRARGELEGDILHILWSNDVPLTAKEIRDVFPGKKPAHTTILTALDRLQAKGHVVRVGQAARGIRFAPARSESEHASEAMLGTLADTSDRAAALLKFAGNLDAKDVKLLREALTPRSPQGRKPKR